jgi:hypothetical protein
MPEAWQRKEAAPGATTRTARAREHHRTGKRFFRDGFLMDAKRDQHKTQWKPSRRLAWRGQGREAHGLTLDRIDTRDGDSTTAEGKKMVSREKNLTPGRVHERRTLDRPTKYPKNAQKRPRERADRPAGYPTT